MNSIVGVGVDIVELARIAKIMQYNERFANKILGEQEYLLWQARKCNIGFIAKRFAAKEAISKALGTGFRYPLTWHSIQILPNINGLGKPEFAFSNDMLHYINHNAYICHVSLTDEKQYAVAYVIVEKITNLNA
jgi:holo-[acyl-carrier protein] synthase